VPQTVAAITREGGLVLDAGDELLCCRFLPAQLARAHRFNVACSGMIAAHYGGKDGLAAELGISRRSPGAAAAKLATLDAKPSDWFMLEGDIGPVLGIAGRE
jgi:hypothetical protein